MSDRYPASFYDQHHHHPHHLAPTMSHYPPQPYRSGYTGYHPYGYGYGSSSSASYMPNYYRYAPYASPHYSQHHQGMFTPAGQQIIPSSVLHYPPRPHPYQQIPQQQQPHPQQSQPGYEPPPPLPYSSSASYQSRGFGGFAGPTPHYAPPGRSSTPAPNRTVLPPSYLEPLRSYSAEQQHLSQQQHLNQQQLQHHPLPGTPKLEDPDVEVEAVAESPAQRLTTSPPMISATGTDSGISNCSTRARSDSSQSTPVYSGEYPVNMSVESASCVPYHCPADAREYEEEEHQPPVTAEVRRADTPLDITGKLSAFFRIASHHLSFLHYTLFNLQLCTTAGENSKIYANICQARLCNKYSSRQRATAIGQLLQLKSTILATVGGGSKSIGNLGAIRVGV
ncbi:GM22163 [Drosophila sechellia]|uniref:GM22163 n=1 Tax=Drosophila sechellia TaxID=7238 RepID=B4IAK4_DROSE|nr:GM22163 [Drosophila sechellia]